MAADSFFMCGCFMQIEIAPESNEKRSAEAVSNEEAARD